MCYVELLSIHAGIVPFSRAAQVTRQDASIAIKMLQIVLDRLFGLLPKLKDIIMEIDVGSLQHKDVIGVVRQQPDHAGTRGACNS